MRVGLATIVVLVIAALAEAPAVASVATITLAELVTDAEFVGVVRVVGIRPGIPFLLRRRARATILESWKGQTHGEVTFVAAPTWICDISDAARGEEAVVFLRRGNLLHAGRGRMPTFMRNGRTLAEIWPDVKVPAGITTEDGPKPEYRFIRGVAVGDLRDAVTILRRQASP